MAGGTERMISAIESSSITPGPLGMADTRPSADAPLDTARCASSIEAMQQILILGMVDFIVQSQALARCFERFWPEHRTSACVLFKRERRQLLIQALSVFPHRVRQLPRTFISSRLLVPVGTSLPKREDPQRRRQSSVQNVEHSGQCKSFSVCDRLRCSCSSHELLAQAAASPGKRFASSQH